MSNGIQEVRICQNTACKKSGSLQVLAAFQAQSLLNITIIGSRCLGQCGSGPMVVVLPEETWYSRVLPGEVPAIVERHLKRGEPIKAMLYRKFHPSS